MTAEHEAALEYEPAAMAGLPPFMASGPGREALRASGNGHPTPAFGLAGQHRLGPTPQQRQDPFAPPGAVPSPPLPPPEPGPAAPPRQATMRAQAGPPVPAPGTPSRTGRPSLPQRVREASLAPQLRRRSGPGQPSQREEQPPVLSPDEAAARMAALQDGWQRGRHDDLDPPAGHGDWRTDDYEDE